MYRILNLFVAIACIGLIGCHNHSHDGHNHDDPQNHDPHSHDDHGHDHSYPSMSLQAINQKTELYLDFPVLAVGVSSPLAAHFTQLANYKPYVDGVVKVQMKDGKSILQEVIIDKPTSAGIFVPQLQPASRGEVDLVFYFANELTRDTFEFESVKVYASEDEAIHIAPRNIENDDVEFSKEQAWKVDFGIASVVRSNIQKVIRTSGEVLPMESDQKSITAKSDGIVIFKKSSLVEGQDISSGAKLFVVNNDQLISANLSEKYAILKANLEASKKDLERSRELLEKNIISQREFENRDRQYANDLASYETLNRNYSSGGMTLPAPSAGILKKLFVTDGEYVKEGQTLAVISRNKQLLVQAEVPQQYFRDVPKIQSANLKFPWNENIVSIEDYNGKLLSRGSSTKEHYIPVVFRIDNKGDVMPGTYLEIFLKTTENNDALVIPKSALLKEYDMFFVYVMKSRERYEKRNVTIGIDDGEQVQILSGLDEDEIVIVKGAYAIKMASMSSSIPSHGHAH